MAKSGAVETDRATSARSAAELKKELRRLVAAITEGEEEVPIDSYEKASKALAVLKDLKFHKTSVNSISRSKRSSHLSQEKPQIGSVVVPEQFLCPISSELMKDPVVIASGQTYDRPFIQEWLNSGKRTCPQTQQVLPNSILTPNHLVRSMISQWCSDQGIDLPLLENHEEGLITRGDRNLLDSLLEKISFHSISERKQAVKDLRLLTKRNASFRALLGETSEAIHRLLSVLSVPGLSSDPEVQEDTVTTILNLSIHDSNKKIVGDNPRAIPLLIEALKTGNMETRSNSAAALFTLSALDSNKIKIGELGAMKPLVDLLEQGNLTAKKDAASAIFNLCMAHENKVRVVKEGVVNVTLKTIMDKSLADESLAILAMLSSNQQAAEEIGEYDGVPCLLRIIRESSCERNRENSAVILFSICMNDRRKLREIGEEENLNGTISQLAQNGTSRARRKAAGILERLNRTMHNIHNSC